MRRNIIIQVDFFIYFFLNVFLDTRRDEKERLLSIKSIPMSMILSDSREKSYLINLYDTPGHPNFSDEVCCALRICDGVLLVGKKKKSSTIY